MQEWEAEEQEQRQKEKMKNKQHFFSVLQKLNPVSADLPSHSLAPRLKAWHHINLFKYLDIIQDVFFFHPLSVKLREKQGVRWSD